MIHGTGLLEKMKAKGFSQASTNKYLFLAHALKMTQFRRSGKAIVQLHREIAQSKKDGFLQEDTLL